MKAQRPAIFISILLFLAGCQAYVGPGTGDLEISFAVRSVSGRTITSALDTVPAEFEIRGSSGGAQFSLTADADVTSVTQSDLMTGIWTISVDARNSTGQVVLRGNGSATVQNGLTSAIDIILVPVAGTGNLDFTFSWPAGAVTDPAVESVLSPGTGGDPESLSFTVDAETGTASYSGSYQAGYYTLQVFLYDGDAAAWGEAWAVQILADATTASVLDLQTTDLSASYVLSGTWSSLDETDELVFLPAGPLVTLDPATSPIHDPAFYPDDPLFAEQWNLSLLDMPAVWGRVTGDAGVVVAVVDTGIDATLPDLSGVSFVPGWNVVDGNSDTSDNIGHGTHVAGIIAQATDNAYGTAGMAYGVSIMPVKVIRDDGSSEASLIAGGIQWAVDNGADVINLSIGDPNATTPDGMEDVHTAVQNAVAAGIPVVAAVGNNDGAVRYPAAFPEVIAVGAVTYSFDRAWYSNYGPEMEIVAPGGDAADTVLGNGLHDAILQETAMPMPLGEPHATESDFWYLVGTSQAAPHVSALAALLKSVDPTRTPAEIRSAIVSTSTDLGATGWDQYYGYGLVDPVAALTYGINTYHQIVDQDPLGFSAETVHDVWSLNADAGIVDLDLAIRAGDRQMSLLLYDADGRLVAVGDPVARGASLYYEVNVAGGQFYAVVAAD